LTYNTPTGGGPGYYSVWIKGNNLPDSTSNWWFNLQNTYTSSKTAPAAFNDTIPTLVKATKVFIPDTVETDKENIGLYPNPVHDTLNAVYQLTASSTVTVRVFDITGKMLMKIDEGKRAAGQNKIIINVSGLTANVYIVQVLANSKKVMAKKFIKQ
ncbi:MAG: T9SS type A sorting domain-containing protein, partial [Sphingobacteriaceae bacterium]